ncbi:hypothetical protein F5051DRAFT_401237 [Lentinula edodes]|nr:hypothetical protein F5051DRAFT_401237 [Lentinula edodes]
MSITLFSFIFRGLFRIFFSSVSQACISHAVYLFLTMVPVLNLYSCPRRYTLSHDLHTVSEDLPLLFPLLSPSSRFHLTCFCSYLC